MNELEKRRYQESLKKTRYEESLDLLESKKPSSFSFRGTQYLEVSLPLIGTYPVFTQDMGVRKNWRIKKNLCDLLHIDNSIVTYGNFVTENPNHEKFEIGEYDKEALGKNILNEYKEVISYLEQLDSELHFSKPQNELLNDFKNQGKTTKNLIDKIRGLFKEHSILENIGVHSFFELNDDNYKRILRLKSLDEENEIRGFSKITYLAEGISPNKENRKIAAYIFEKYKIQPRREKLKTKLDQFQDTTVNIMILNYDAYRE